MSPYYRFMTAAQSYRVEAASLEEAFAYVVREINPTPDARALIRATIREETPSDFLPKPPPVDDESLGEEEDEGE